MGLIQRLRLKWLLWRSRKELQKIVGTYFIIPLSDDSVVMGIDELWKLSEKDLRITFDLSSCSWKPDPSLTTYPQPLEERDFDYVA